MRCTEVPIKHANSDNGLHLKSYNADLRRLIFKGSDAKLGAWPIFRGRTAWRSAAVLSGLFLTAADPPRGGVTLHLNVEEDVPIVLPNCNVVVPFKR